MGIEKYIAVASLGLFIMFTGEIIIMFNFMIDAPFDIEPGPKIFQFISIGVAPALVMAVISFIMVKHSGSKQIASMIIAGGVILIAGMGVAYTMLDDINELYLIEVVTITPPIFMVVGVVVVVIGSFLLKIKQMRPKKDYFQ